MKLVPRLLLALALLWIGALLLQAPLAVDEVEFFRATRWTGEGDVPYRDFWEHHTPLQWLLFAPFAPGWPGAEAIVLMRWLQLPLWIATFALLLRELRREGLDPMLAVVLLLASATFVHRAIEYRVDVPGNLAFFGALALVSREASARRWIAYGVLMSAAVLANMRMAPLAIVVSALVLVRQLRALWMLAGVAASAIAFIGWLAMTGAWTPFVESIIDYNVTSARLLEVDTFFDALLAPLRTRDVGGIAFWIAGLAGIVIAFRTGRMRVHALVAVASVVTVAMMEVQYDYHFQTTWLLLLPLVALTLDTLRDRWRPLIGFVAAAALVTFVAGAAFGLGEELAYQDALMTSADALAGHDERVLDGAGYALTREPAYRYWFLTTGVRMMAARRLIDPYELRDVAADPPAVVIADYRLRLYLESFPDVARYVGTHYVPLFRNLWIPGMSVRVERPSRVVWIAPRAGRYDVWSSEALADHPWITNPLAYPDLQEAARYAIALRPLEPVEGLEWRVDGAVQPRGTASLVLRKGSRVELLANPPRRAAILLVPNGIEVLGLAPADEIVF